MGGDALRASAGASARPGHEAVRNFGIGAPLHLTPPMPTRSDAPTLLRRLTSRMSSMDLTEVEKDAPFSVIVRCSWSHTPHTVPQRVTLQLPESVVSSLKAKAALAEMVDRLVMDALRSSIRTTFRCPLLPLTLLYWGPAARGAKEAALYHLSSARQLQEDMVIEARAGAVAT